jgi:hypothetical protein
VVHPRYGDGSFAPAFHTVAQAGPDGGGEVWGVAEPDGGGAELDGSSATVEESDPQAVSAPAASTAATASGAVARQILMG